MGSNKFEVGQIYRYTDNDQIYSLMIDRVGVDNVYYSTMSPRRIGGGSFHKDSSLAGLLTLSGESDGLLCAKDQRIKELESTILDLQSELARKKMSLTVACNRVEELEDKLKIAVDALKPLANAENKIFKNDKKGQRLRQG